MRGEKERDKETEEERIDEDNERLRYLLYSGCDFYKNESEDMLIHQPDGTRACVGWELSGGGYRIMDPEEDPYSVL